MRKILAFFISLVALVTISFGGYSTPTVDQSSPPGFVQAVSFTQTQSVDLPAAYSGCFTRGVPLVQGPGDNFRHYYSTSTVTRVSDIPISLLQAPEVLYIRKFLPFTSSVSQYYLGNYPSNNG